MGCANCKKITIDQDHIDIIKSALESDLELGLVYLSKVINQRNKYDAASQQLIDGLFLNSINVIKPAVNIAVDAVAEPEPQKLAELSADKPAAA